MCTLLFYLGMILPQISGCIIKKTPETFPIYQPGYQINCFSLAIISIKYE